MAQIESFLAARLFLSPQLVDGRIYFISNLAGHMSLYAIDYGGSVPEPLLPPDIAMQNPILLEGSKSYFVFPKLGKILVMLDNDGDEKYQPKLIPLDGGYPEPVLEDIFIDYRLHLGACDIKNNLCYLSGESLTEQMNTSFQWNLATHELRKVAESPWGAYISAHNKDHSKLILVDAYLSGDTVLYLWEKDKNKLTTLFGVPIEDRKPGQVVEKNGVHAIRFMDHDRALIIACSIFEDTYGLGYLRLKHPQEVKPVAIKGLKHHGKGEFYSCTFIGKNTYLIEYNIDGCSWLYEAKFDPEKLQMIITHVLVGKHEIANGVLESVYFNKGSSSYVLSHSTATSPTQIFTIEGKKRNLYVLHTREKVLGLPEALLSAGEDASFTSFDGLRVSARLYLPPAEVKFQPPYPLVYYIHGGPQSQERPDFAWFSMPLIQFLILNGFAVYVPNVRGSSGYGLKYMQQVDRDWGGMDRLDHVHAMKLLKKDTRLDVSHSGVVGRSYGGYMTLTMASRHPELWSAAVDMFGPYDLLTFSDRIPETWKPYFKIALGDPVEDHDFLVERSPRTYIDQILCPLLVIQGKNDPRVIEQESRDLVDHLRGLGKQVDYLVFENEGHDVLKLENRITCYNTITDFFKQHLMK
jgi:pimeloyl-ACP methyl ester carboxylesterase